MAASTTVYGIPYPESSDLVANYPALGLSLANQVDGKLPRYQATAPASPSVGQVWISNADNLGRVWTGAAWIIFSGASPSNFSDAATGTYTVGGVNYKYLTITGTGTITFTRAGLYDILIMGGGGGGSRSAGGAGGIISLNSQYVGAPSTATAYIGGGGAGFTATTQRGSNGTDSYFNGLCSVGGGGGGAAAITPGGLAMLGQKGGSGGGTTEGNTPQGPAVLFQGNQGAIGPATGGGGGGGGAGGAASSFNGGVGSSNSITGTSLTYGIGGSYDSGGGTQNGATNRGGGGWGNAGNGGSGVVIIRVRTN